MPQIGVSVAEGTVVAWRVEVGDPIEADATIAEITTDKIDTEVPSPATGTVTEILVPVESTVSVGTVLARIAVGGGDVPPPAIAPVAHDNAPDSGMSSEASADDESASAGAAPAGGGGARGAAGAP